MFCFQTSSNALTFSLSCTKLGENNVFEIVTLDTHEEQNGNKLGEQFIKLNAIKSIVG